MKNEKHNGNGPFDIIGDIHGYASELRALLGKLGYRERDGDYRHDGGRRVLFLGDFVDRGPRIRETLHIVRAMHAAGSALAVPGNHEFNALAYATPDGRGGWLREHNDKNDVQHAATLEQFAGREEEWRGHMEWFRALPLWIELPGLRAVHAAWSFDAVAVLGGAERMDDALVRAASVKGAPEFEAVEMLLKGIEVPLPKGHKFFDAHADYARRKIRTRWWLPAKGATFRDIALQPSADAAQFPELPADAHAATLPGYAADERPIFNGHYWLEGEPELMAPNVAILDYSIAKGGALTAYRWDGEQRLDAAKFLQVQAEKAPGRVDRGSPNDSSLV